MRERREATEEERGMAASHSSVLEELALSVECARRVAVYGLGFCLERVAVPKTWCMHILAACFVRCKRGAIMLRGTLTAAPIS